MCLHTLPLTILDAGGAGFGVVAHKSRRWPAVRLGWRNAVGEIKEKQRDLGATIGKL